ncbi:RidA family protein [Hydrotalea sp.]|uniref:RidA family protein n=1 Tax=Hydrotalea sp. TaxID=2881279 RepID=UPI002632B155|nr:RidA family protein [Hydrotalea sp.]
MMKQIIKTEKAPAPIGPYNQAVKAGDTIYLSGQIAIHPESGQLVTDNITAETHQVMQNIKAILNASNITFEHVVKTTIFLSDMDLFTAVNEVYGSYFSGDYPARETIAVKGLPKNVHVEISIIALQYL